MAKTTLVAYNYKCSYLFPENKINLLLIRNNFLVAFPVSQLFSLAFPAWRGRLCPGFRGM